MLDLLIGAVTNTSILLLFNAATDALNDFIAYDPIVEFSSPKFIVTDSFHILKTLIFL